ncbi:MAG: ABC transporter ATP-binding protein/permease [Acidimicrobiia bacterium]|nr:ABC transporter ATP-binding protein/permease [Acidimicrobiia bacterium]
MDLPPESPSRSVLGLGVRLVVRMYRMHPLPASVAVVGALLTALGIVGSSVVIGRITDQVVLPAFEEGATVTVTDALWGVVAVLCVAIIRSVGTVLRRYYAGMTTQQVERSLRERLSRYYLELPMEFHQRSMAGRLLAHADNDTMMATNVLDPVPFTLGTFFLMFFAAISLLMIDLLIAGVALLIFPAMYALNRIYTSRIEGPTAAVQAGVGRVSSVAHESFDGALVVKTLGRARQESQRFELQSGRLRDDRIRVGNVRAVFEAVLDAMPSLGIAAVVLIGAFRIEAGAMTGGDVVQVAALFTLLAFPMRVLGYFLEMVPRSVVSHRRLQTVWNEQLPESPLRRDRDPVPTSRASHLSVEHVSYVYPALSRLDDREDADTVPQPVETQPANTLIDVSFNVEPGEVVAIVGGTASGKSTVCSLLAGLTEPSSGSITLDGHPVSDLPVETRTNHVALVFQESFLFGDSIAENIAFGTPDPDRLVAAAQIAAADGFIAELPESYDTVVGERGVTLSGGQRQRVALARALYRRPGLIILDDATSAVDPVVEQRILKALRNELDTTAVIVAQRLSTIELADRVVYIDKGRVVGVGNHAELLQHPGYRSLVEAYEEAAA